MKKKRKQFAAMFLAVMMAFCGCTGTNEKTEKNDAHAEIQIEEIPEETPEIQEETPLHIEVTRNLKAYESEQPETTLLYLQYCDVVIEGSAYEALKRTVDKWAMQRGEELRTQAEQLKDEAAEDAKTEEYFYGYQIYQNVSIARADDGIVSFIEDISQYAGGSHTKFFKEGINFDAQSGKRVRLSEIMVDYDGFQKEAKQYIGDELEKKHPEEICDDYLTKVDALWKNGTEPDWYVDASGIVVLLRGFFATDDSMGIIEIHLPYSKFGYYLKEKYLPGSGDGVARLGKNQEMDVQLSESTEPMKLKLDYQWDDGFATTSLCLNGSKHNIGEFSSLETAYLIRSGDEVLCLVETDMASDDYRTYIFRLTEGVIQGVDQIDASIDDGNINYNSVVMESWIYLLGTYAGIKDYTLDEKKGFTTEDREFRLYKNNYALTTKRDLTVKIEGKESTLPAGSKIILNGTDGDSYVKFTIQGTGQTGTLEVERETEGQYSLLVNGIDENECFEMLPYAG